MVDIDPNNMELGPVAIARKAHEAIQEGESKKITNHTIFVETDINQFGGFNVTLSFHEDELERPFVFTGARTKIPEELREKMFLIWNKPASHPKELGQDIGTVADILEITYDMPQFEFVQVKAASIGGMGQLTDYEFQYEAGDVDREPAVDIDTAIEKSVVSVWEPDRLGDIFGMEM